MKCYYTGEDCDCGGDMETECPHDVMVHDDLPGLVEELPRGRIYDEGYLASERKFAEMSDQMEPVCPALRH